MSARLSTHGLDARASKDSQREFVRARWKPDSEARSCDSCRSFFSTLKRRHHCRLCGGCFCATCTASRVSLPCSKEPQRVCDVCVRTHARATSPRQNLERAEAERRDRLVTEFRHKHADGLFELAAQAHVELLRQSWREGQSERPSLGMQLAADTSVGSLDMDGAAARAGLSPGDRVIRIGDRMVQSVADIRRVEDSLRFGETVQAVVRKSGDDQPRAVDIQVEPKSCGATAGGSSQGTDETRSPGASHAQSPSNPGQPQLSISREEPAPADRP